MSRKPSSHRVLLTAGTERDLEALHAHLLRSEGSTVADRLLQQLLEVTMELSDFPQRGNFPAELLELGIREYRQIFFKPWRLIYRIDGDELIIHLLVDGRRDLRALLARRLLSA